MSVENPKVLKVIVLLEHHEGDANWAATVPLIDGCLAEAKTPGEATEAIIPEIEFFIEKHPELLETLKRQPEFLITQVEIPLKEV